MIHNKQEENQLNRLFPMDFLPGSATAAASLPCLPALSTLSNAAEAAKPTGMDALFPNSQRRAAASTASGSFPTYFKEWQGCYSA